MFFNKTFTDELSSIKSAFQSTHDKTASQCPYYKALCKEELQRYIKNARQFFKTTKNEENFYFSSSYGVFNVL